MISCFLLGMATRAEAENAKEEIEKEAKPVATAVGGGKAFEDGVLDSDVTGDWTQDEIEYFQKKEYVGDKKRYTPYSIDYFPPYLKVKIKEELEKYGIIGERGVEEIIREGKVSKLELLRYYNLLQNEIYARKGYVLENSGLEEFFAKMHWYQPKSKEIALTGREERNFKVIEKLKERVKSTKVVSGLFAKQIIIKAKWGKGPGEFKLEPFPESYEYRTSFTIDEDGNVYIEDPNNQRINVFSKEGKFTKSMPIPEQLIYTYEDKKTSLVEGVGVDKNGNIYLVSSSTTELLASGSSGEVVLKMDEKGKVLDSLTFKGYYVYPPIFYEINNVMYLWGSWEGKITAGVPLEFGKRGAVTELTLSQLRDNSFDHHRKSVNLSSRRIKINYDKAPVVFNESKDSKVVFYDRLNFVFQDSDEEIKSIVSSNSDYFRHYPLGYGIPYKGHYILISTWPYIDKDLNIYCIDGTDTHLRVIKYTPSEEVWK